MMYNWYLNKKEYEEFHEEIQGYGQSEIVK